MTLTQNEIIYSDILKELELLYIIAPQNDNLKTIEKAAQHLKNNKKALLLIKKWLQNINKNSQMIQEEEEHMLSQYIKEILTSIPYNTK